MGNDLNLSQKTKLSSADQWFEKKRAELKKQQQKVLRLKMEGFDVKDYKMGITGRYYTSLMQLSVISIST